MQGIKICRALFPGYKPSVADIDPKKREAALAAGAAEAIDPADAAQTGPIAMAAMTGKGGYAAIIDFVGAGATVQGATALLRRGGALIVVGLFGGSMQLSTAMLPFRAWKIQGSYVGSPKEMAELAALAAAGNCLPRSSLSGTFSEPIPCHVLSIQARSKRSRSPRGSWKTPTRSWKNSRPARLSGVRY